LEEAHEIVQANLACAFQRQARHYDLRRQAWKPTIGDIVWKRAHTLSSKKDSVNAKLALKYIGPLMIRKIILPVIVDLRSRENGTGIYVQDLKPAPKGENNK